MSHEAGKPHFQAAVIHIETATDEEVSKSTVGMLKAAGALVAAYGELAQLPDGAEFPPHIKRLIINLLGWAGTTLQHMTSCPVIPMALEQLKAESDRIQQHGNATVN